MFLLICATWCPTEYLSPRQRLPCLNRGVICWSRKTPWRTMRRAGCTFKGHGQVSLVNPIVLQSESSRQPRSVVRLRPFFFTFLSFPPSPPPSLAFFLSRCFSLGRTLSVSCPGGHVDEDLCPPWFRDSWFPRSVCGHERAATDPTFPWRLSRGPEEWRPRSAGLRECVCAIMCHLPRCVFRRGPFGDKWRLTLNADARTIACTDWVLFSRRLSGRMLSNLRRERLALRRTRFRREETVDKHEFIRGGKKGETHLHWGEDTWKFAGYKLYFLLQE